jgi:hypothetical protein
MGKLWEIVGKGMDVRNVEMERLHNYECHIASPVLVFFHKLLGFQYELRWKEGLGGKKCGEEKTTKL